MDSRWSESGERRGRIVFKSVRHTREFLEYVHSCIGSLLIYCNLKSPIVGIVHFSFLNDHIVGMNTTYCVYNMPLFKFYTSNCNDSSAVVTFLPLCYFQFS